MNSTPTADPLPRLQEHRRGIEALFRDLARGPYHPAAPLLGVVLVDLARAERLLQRLPPEADR